MEKRGQSQGLVSQPHPAGAIPSFSGQKGHPGTSGHPRNGILLISICQKARNVLLKTKVIEFQHM